MNRAGLALLALGGLALLSGLTGALVLLGLTMPAPTLRLAAVHGLFMALGFLGTMIALERAVALGAAWGYLSPAASGLGALALLAGLPAAVAGTLLLIGGLAFAAMYVAFDRIEVALHTRTQAVGAVAWPVGVILWLSGRPVSAIVPWLAAFLVLVIAGERLELSRLGSLPPAARRTFVGVVALLAAGTTLTLVLPDPGTRLAGLGLLALTAWLVAHDMARRTVRMRGVTRYIALCLLVGYAWLALGGALWLTIGASAGGPGYDAMLHAVFLGFVMSMVFGHAPVIIPAVLRIPLPYAPRFYLHLLLLHLGLLVRIAGGDLAGSTILWQLGGVLNVVALLLFVASSAFAAIGGQRARRATMTALRARAAEAPKELQPERVTVE